MSGNLNSIFISNPRTFLMTRILTMHPDLVEPIEDKKSQEMIVKYNAGIYDFDITQHADGSAALWMFGGRQFAAGVLKTDRLLGKLSKDEEAQLKRAGGLMRNSLYVKPTGTRTHRITAHFLPYLSGQTTSIQLNSTASYFFTVQLSGCQLRFIPSAYSRGSTNHPRILHVAGDIAKREDAAKDAHKALGTPGFVNWNLTRGLSMSKLQEKDPFGYGISDAKLTEFVKKKRDDLGLKAPAKDKDDKAKDEKGVLNQTEFIFRVNVVGQLWAWRWYFYAQMVIYDSLHERAFLYKTWDLPWH